MVKLTVSPKYAIIQHTTFWRKDVIITSWTERMPADQYLAGIDRLQEVMQSEIDELRERNIFLEGQLEGTALLLQECGTEIQRVRAANLDCVDHFDAIRADYETQRKVLEQALQSLENITHTCRDIDLQYSKSYEAIAAIEECLK